MNFETLGIATDAGAFKAQREKRAKATVHKSGLTGMNRHAAELLDLTPSSRVLINTEGENWYVKVVEGDERAFRLKFVSNYYSIRTRDFFDAIKLDYRDLEHTHIFDISQIGVDDVDQKPIWFFKHRMVQSQSRAKKEVDAPTEEY